MKAPIGHYLSQCECGVKYPADLNKCPKCADPDWNSTLSPLSPRDYVYDIEVLPNIFTWESTHVATGSQWSFEMSDRIDQGQELIDHLRQLQNCDARMVGYNSVGYDYPIIHFIMTNPRATYKQIHAKSLSIIKSNDRFGHLIWENDRLIEQLDLYKIHHFDNISKATSLKALEVAMRMPNVSEFEMSFDDDVTDEDKPKLIKYNKHDVKATVQFYVRSLPQIKLREDLTEKFGRSFMNYSDVKMGEVLLVQELERHGIQCYEKIAGKRQPRQTVRGELRLKEVVFDYVKFERPEFQALMGWVVRQVITKTKGVFKGITDPTLEPYKCDDKTITSEKRLHVTVDGLPYVFGTGGLHASIHNTVVRSDDYYVIVDVDVASYYPNMAIANGLFPAHLSKSFCDAYAGIYKTRKSFAKGTPENAAYKLALNGAYGGSNNAYSPFFDSLYTMAITINGQLMLCMLVEQLIKTPDLTMIQCNTDGVTFRVPRKHLEHTRTLCRWWEGVTGLELEEAIYKMMALRDVNSYLAVTESGKVKRIGAYAHLRPDENPGTREIVWNKDPSALVIPKAAEAALVHGVSVREFITNHGDPFDFMIRAQSKGKSYIELRWVDFDIAIKQQKISRYFASTEGGYLFKVSPPTGKLGTWKRATKLTDNYYNGVLLELSSLGSVEGIEVDSDGIPHDERIHTKNKSRHIIREERVSAGQMVTMCNDAVDFDWSLIDFEYYIEKAEKIVLPLLEGKL